jgi:hypothetical protein
MVSRSSTPGEIRKAGSIAWPCSKLSRYLALVRASPAMNRLLPILCYLAILLAAFHWSYCASGFLVTGLGVVVLIDKYAIRLLPWQNPITWRRELCLGGGAFAAGAIGFYWMRPGIVPLWEAIYRGFIVSLVVLLGETAVSLASHMVDKYGLARFYPKWASLGLRCFLLGLLILTVPVVAALHPLHTVPKRTPAAFGLEFEDLRFHTADGMRLAGWLVPHPNARGSVIFAMVMAETEVIVPVFCLPCMSCVSMFWLSIFEVTEIVWGTLPLLDIERGKI